jgi:hypothetical protein
LLIVATAAFATAARAKRNPPLAVEAAQYASLLTQVPAVGAT